MASQSSQAHLLPGSFSKRWTSCKTSQARMPEATRASASPGTRYPLWLAGVATKPQASRDKPYERSVQHWRLFGAPYTALSLQKGNIQDVQRSSELGSEQVWITAQRFSLESKQRLQTQARLTGLLRMSGACLPPGSGAKRWSYTLDI